MSLALGSCTALAGLAGLGTLILVGGLLGLLVVRAPALAGRRAWLLPGAGLVALLCAGGAGALAAGRCAAPVAACPDPPGVARRNLLADPQLAAEATPGGTSWVVSGTLQKTLPGAPLAPAAGSDLFSARVRVHPGTAYCLQARLSGSGHGQVLVLWDDATLKQIGFAGPAPQPAGQTVQAAAVAPVGATYARLLLRATDGAPVFQDAALADPGVRVESWPNGARAALAFSFDWESAMGGLIHSKSGHDRQYAVGRGLNMRAGADTLLGFFQEQHIQATFYATGFNLLDGNTARRQWAGNPTFKWGPGQGWATTWWYTNTWYGDDPYGTVASDPAWYFGDQTDRLAAAGQEIGSHTFGHLYVRGTKPDQLGADLDAWVAAAAARHLPPLHSFAFPWQSSNSLTADFYQVLAAHGVDSVTRLYPPDLCRGPLECDRYIIRASPVYSPVLILPDFQLGITGPDSAEAGPNVVTSTVQAQAVISATIARGGVTSFWNHPEVATLPAVRTVWHDTIAAAAAARDRGDLWIAPVSTLAHYWRDVGAVSVSTTQAGARLQITVTNASPDPLDGVTLALPRTAQAVSPTGSATVGRRADQVVLARLGAGQTVPITVDLAPEASAP